MERNLQQLVIEEFGSEPAQKLYCELAEKGLWQSEESLIDRYFKPGASVLDLGCGTGRTTMPLVRKGYQMIGVDITPQMIENAKRIAQAKNVEIPYELGDAAALRFQDCSFDCVLFSNQGWTQIPGNACRLQALREVHRVLKPGGTLIFTTHVRNLFGPHMLGRLTVRYSHSWIVQWVKLYLLKPLGVPILEQEWGDVFFKRERSTMAYPRKQYIHIPRVEEIEAQIHEVGFDLVEMRRAHEIIHGDQLPNSPMFYICRKADDA